MPATQQQATRAPRQARRQTSIEATLRVGRKMEEHSGPTTLGATKTELSSRDEAWIDSLTPEQLLTECRRREIELPSTGGNVITRRARLRKHVLEHGRTIKTKAEKPPVGGPPVKTATNTSSGPDAGQTQRTAKQPPPPPEDKKRNKGKQPPPPQGNTSAQKPPAPPAPPTPPVQTQARNQDAPRPRWFWPALAAVIALGIIGLLVTAIVLLATRDNNDNGNNSAPASSGQQATPAQTTALTESQVKNIANAAAQQAIKDAGLASTSDVQKIVNDAVNKAVAELKTNAGLTPSDVKRIVDAYVQSQKQAVQAGGNVLTSGVNAASWTPATKCEWLRGHFPQTTGSVQALGAKLANVQTQRVATHLYPCDATNTVFDGFIVLGPNEGYSGSFSIDVPANGAVDSYPGATFTGTNRRIGSETIRATSGKVTATRATYWPWDDNNPPTGASAAKPDQPPVDNVCVLGKDLASQMKWPLIGDQSDDITKYGGARIHLDNAAQLPAQWEGISGGRKIATDSSDRTMVQGDWSIYPPPGSCRDQLGVAK